MHLSGAKLWSQWLVEPPSKPPLLDREKTWHLGLSSLRGSFIRWGEELTEDVDGDKGDDGCKVGIVASLVEQFPSLFDLSGRQSDEVVRPAHGCRIAGESRQEVEDTEESKAGKRAFTRRFRRNPGAVSEPQIRYKSKAGGGPWEEEETEKRYEQNGP